METAPSREVPPKQPSLFDLSITIAPFAHIKQIRLVESTISSKSNTVAEPAKLHHSFDAKSILNSDERSLVVRSFLTVSASDFLEISAEFCLEYSIDSGVPITDEIVAAFGRMNGVHNVWPYWREYVQSISMRAGLPPMTLPLMTGTSMLAYYTEKDRSVASGGELDSTGQSEV